MVPIVDFRVESQRFLLIESGKEACRMCDSVVISDLPLCALRPQKKLRLNVSEMFFVLFNFTSDTSFFVPIYELIFKVKLNLWKITKNLNVNVYVTLKNVNLYNITYAEQTYVKTVINVIKNKKNHVLLISTPDKKEMKNVELDVLVHYDQHLVRGVM